MSSNDDAGENREESDFEGVPDEVLEKRVEEFRQILLDERSKIVSNAKRTLTEDMTIDVDDLADEMDHATADQTQGLAFRLRGRERMLFTKIDEAIERLESGDYWWCDDCEAWIGFRRLRARPVTTLCIVCKEKRERRERSYAH